MILTETPKRRLISRLVSWGHWFALYNIGIAIVIAGIYLFGTKLPESPLGITYLFTNWFSHIGFLTFIGFVIFILPLCYLVPNSRFIRAYSSFIAAIGLALLAFDALLYTSHGLHISINSAELVKQQANSVIADFGWQQWGFLVVLFVIWLLFQLTLANALWKRIERLQKLKIGVPITSAFVACFVFSHLTHIWADAKLYDPILQQDNLFPISYPATAKTLMSKYGFLDLATYRNKKQLRFNHEVYGFDYPREPLYCATNNPSSTILVFSKAKPRKPVLPNTLTLPLHLDLSENDEDAVLSVLFGLPSIFHEQVAEKIPLLLDIPAKLGMDVKIYNDLTNNTENKTNTVDSWDEFKDAVANSNGLFIVFTEDDKSGDLLSSMSANSYFFVSHIQANTQVNAYSNFPTAQNLLVSSHQDIASTALSAMGCDLPTELHSTGQNLTKRPRNWAVSSQSDKIVVANQQGLTMVDKSGNYQIYDFAGNQLNNDGLNLPLFGQAIKLLSVFSQEQ